MRLGRIGFDHVAGYLKGGMQPVESRPDLVGRTIRLTAADLAQELSSHQPPFVLDVRTPREWREKHLAASVNIPLSHLRENAGLVPHDRRVVVHCASGYRSSIAASLLQLQGVSGVTDLVGGIAAWQAASLPVASSG